MFTFRVGLIGSSRSGKSSIIKRFNDSGFSEEYECTHGIDFKIKEVIFSGVTLRVQMWEANGGAKFQQMIIQKYYTQSHVCICVVDLSNALSFQEIKNCWLPRIRAGFSSKAGYFLVGNKADLLDNKIGKAQVLKFCEKEGFTYFEVSCKTGEGVQHLLQSLQHRKCQLTQFVLMQIKQFD